MWESVIREPKARARRGRAARAEPERIHEVAASGCAVRASQIPHSVSSRTIVRLMHPAAIRPPEGDV